MVIAASPLLAISSPILQFVSTKALRADIRGWTEQPDMHASITTGHLYALTLDSLAVQLDMPGIRSVVFNRRSSV